MTLVATAASDGESALARTFLNVTILPWEAHGSRGYVTMSCHFAAKYRPSVPRKTVQ